jgi:hypothetical protein
MISLITLEDASEDAPDFEVYQREPVECLLTSFDAIAGRFMNTRSLLASTGTSIKELNRHLPFGHDVESSKFH